MPNLVKPGLLALIHFRFVFSGSLEAQQDDRSYILSQEDVYLLSSRLLVRWHPKGGHGVADGQDVN